MIVHRIVVAHDASRACREKLGGSGSLMLDSSLVGDSHQNMPFTVGQIDPAKGYVHVFDDTTLDIVMSTLLTFAIQLPQIDGEQLLFPRSPALQMMSTENFE